MSKTKDIDEEYDYVDLDIAWFEGFNLPDDMAIHVEFYSDQTGETVDTLVSSWAELQAWADAIGAEEDSADITVTVLGFEDPGSFDYEELDDYLGGDDD